MEEYRATTAFGLANLSTASYINLFNTIFNTDTAGATRKLYERYRTVSTEATQPTPAPPPDTIIGVVFTVICGNALTFSFCVFFFFILSPLEIVSSRILFEKLQSLGVLVVLAGLLAWYKCRSFKHKTYEQELAEGLR